uniref:RNase H type-1 domain-containing protein n=1 Tax=Nelumbo nucifera TaxID=4432 RepID=A0A822ZD26_NELNU|nr:TPA_asm: hypothetical protein HUJ06_015250 [Nelumbo nucifera]
MDVRVKVDKSWGKVGFVQDPIEAEFAAVLEALFLANDRGWRELTIISDANVMVEAIKGHEAIIS